MEARKTLQRGCANLVDVMVALTRSRPWGSREVDTHPPSFIEPKNWERM